MSLLNSFFCPKCRGPFPLLIPLSQQVRRGFLQGADLECPRCGQRAHPAVSWKSAIWSWPITFVLTTALIYVIRIAPFFRTLHREGLLLYVIAGILFVVLPFFVGFRRGFQLLPVEDKPAVAQSAKRPWVPWLLFIIMIVGLGLFTHRWTSLAIGVTAMVLVWALANPFRKKPQE